MVHIRRVGVLSLGKLLGILYLALGLIYGAFFALFSLIAMVGAILSNSAEGAIGALFGLIAIVAFPIGFGLMGFVSGIITAWLYNLVAGWVGGIQVELQS